MMRNVVRWPLLVALLALGVLLQYGLGLIPALTYSYMGIGELDEPKEWPRRVPDDWPAVEAVGFHYIGLLWDQRFYETGPSYDRYAIWRLRTGFPMRSLVTDDIDEWHAEAFDKPKTNTPINQNTWWERGFRVRKNSWAVPIRPLWTGLVLDVLLLAASMYGIICGILMFVGRARMRKGRCARCGYRLDEADPCPECGTSVRRTQA